MGVTKTDFMRGMQCPRMLWLDKHHPELKIIPPYIRDRLNRGNEFGDSMMGIFGPYEEVKEYYPGTTRPNKKEMVRKTLELIDFGVKVICEAAFMDDQGNYCAVDILRWNDERNCYDLYEVKNSVEVSEQFIKDAGYQAYLIRKIGLRLDKVFIIYHGEEPYEIQEVTDQANDCAVWVSENINRLNAVMEQREEVYCEIGIHCSDPYECWYIGFCRMKERGELELPRCKWCNLGNPLYVSYHDNEWGVPCHDDHDLYELFILESFQAGLNWEIVLNKRENFRTVYDDFDIDKVCEYDSDKVDLLLTDKGIIRNKLKIKASIRNSRNFRDIQREFGSFDRYIWSFTDGKTIYENDPEVTTSSLSDAISKDLSRRGMSFVGSTMIYSYLQAIGVINAHGDECYLFAGKSPEK